MSEHDYRYNIPYFIDSAHQREPECPMCDAGVAKIDVHVSASKPKEQVIKMTTDFGLIDDVADLIQYAAQNTLQSNAEAFVKLNEDYTRLMSQHLDLRKLFDKCCYMLKCAAEDKLSQQDLAEFLEKMDTVPEVTPDDSVYKQLHDIRYQHNRLQQAYADMSALCGEYHQILEDIAWQEAGYKEAAEFISNLNKSRGE